MLMLVSLIIIINSINGKFISNSGSSSIIVLRHSRLPTDNEQYRIRCPYNLNHLTVTLLNYSNENCFDLYPISINDVCINHRSPCRFHAKSIQLNCNHRPYSHHVDVTYQCSFSSIISTSTTSSKYVKIFTKSTNLFLFFLFSQIINIFYDRRSFNIFFIGYNHSTCSIFSIKFYWY